MGCLMRRGLGYEYLCYVVIVALDVLKTCLARGSCVPGASVSSS